MKNYVSKVMIQFNDKTDKGKEYTAGKIYRCNRSRYEELKKLGALKLLKIERKK